MTPDDETECRRVVLEYAMSKNEWDVLKYIFDRIQEGRHVAPARAALVAGLTNDEFTQRHIAMFGSYIYPRDRKYGTNPGRPPTISRDGPFSNVGADSICSVTERNRTTIEVVAEWPYLSTEGKTMFVLKKKADRWLIEGLKSSKYGGDWEINHL